MTRNGGIELQWLDAADDEGWSPLAAMVGGFWAEAIPGERPLPPSALRAEVLRSAAHRKVHPLLAVARGEPVGAATLVVDDLRAESGWLKLLFVVPEHRRRGIGSRVLDAVRARARDAHRSRVRTSTAAESPAGTRFARCARGRPGLVMEHNRCPAASLDAEELHGWVARAAERAGGYSLVAFDGVCPEEHLEAFAAVIPVMNTAPRVEGTEELAPSPDQVRESMAAHIRQGNEPWTVCARHDGTGRFVGFTERALSSYRPWCAAQGDTGVDPAHRERGIGRWMKAHNALRLLEQRPEVEYIDSWNACGNAAMLAINRAMGFRVVARWQEWDVPT